MIVLEQPQKHLKMAAPYTKRLAEHTREAIRRLNAGDDGAAVVDCLRKLTRVDKDGKTVPHYTVHSLATTICTIKKKALESGRRQACLAGRHFNGREGRVG